MDYFDGFKHVLFRDIGPLIDDSEAFPRCVDALASRYRNAGIDHIIAAEARGYIFGAPLAYVIRTGLVQARKEGNLPGELLTCRYETEYSKECLHIQAGRIRRGDRVLVVDDLLAEGGTALAMADLTERSGGTVEEMAFVIELVGLDGRKRLEDKGYKVFSLIQDSG